jgi:hypothetical protein
VACLPVDLGHEPLVLIVVPLLDARDCSEATFEGVVEAGHLVVEVDEPCVGELAQDRGEVAGAIDLGHLGGEPRDQKAGGRTSEAGNTGAGLRRSSVQMEY